jgi:hypothetical protein
METLLESWGVHHVTEEISLVAGPASLLSFPSHPNNVNPDIGGSEAPQEGACDESIMSCE